MKCNVQLISTLFVVALAVEYCSAIGLLGGLLGNPLMGGYGGCGCGCGAPGLGLGLASRLAYSKIPSLGLGCPSTCCLVHSKPCLATKLLLLKKKLLEKKMSMKCGCGCGCGCGYGGLM